MIPVGAARVSRNSQLAGGIPDSVIYQTESADTTTINESTPWSAIAVAKFDNSESGYIFNAETNQTSNIGLVDKGDFDLNLTGDFADIEYGTVSETGLVIITATLTNTQASTLSVNGSGGVEPSATISAPDLTGTFIVDDNYTNEIAEVLVYNEDINATGLQDDEEQRLADKWNITL